MAPREPSSSSSALPRSPWHVSGRRDLLHPRDYEAVRDVLLDKQANHKTKRQQHVQSCSQLDHLHSSHAHSHFSFVPDDLLVQSSQALDMVKHQEEYRVVRHWNTKTHTSGEDERYSRMSFSPKLARAPRGGPEELQLPQLFLRGQRLPSLLESI